MSKDQLRVRFLIQIVQWGTMSTEEVVAACFRSGPEAGPAWPEGTEEIMKGVCDNDPAGGL